MSRLLEDYQSKIPRSCPGHAREAVLRAVGKVIHYSFERFKDELRKPGGGTLIHIRGLGPISIVQLQEHVLRVQAPDGQIDRVVKEPLARSPYEARNQDIVARRNARETLGAIAARYGITSERVRQIHKNYSQTKQKRTRKAYRSKRQIAMERIAARLKAEAQAREERREQIWRDLFEGHPGADAGASIPNPANTILRAKDDGGWVYFLDFDAETRLSARVQQQLAHSGAMMIWDYTRRT